MKTFSANGQPLPAGFAFELNGLAYPWNWLDLASAADLAAHGIVETTVPDPVVVPEQISDRQFFQQMAAQGVITQADALAAVKTGTVPAALQSLINALPADQQFGATMIVSGATIFNRHHPLTVAIGTAYGWTSSQMDAFWIAAAAL